MKNISASSIALVALFLFYCTGDLSSQGVSLEPIVTAKEASIGKTYTLTLSHINVERDRNGAYLRLFDDKYKTIFVYVSKGQRNKVANLERDTKYNYRFSVTKNDQYSTLSGKLIDVADARGKAISASLKNPGPSAVLIKLDGPEAVGKTFSLPIKLTRMKEDKGAGEIVGESVDAYRTTVTLKYGEDLAGKVKQLKASDKFTAKFKADNVDYRIFGTLIAIE